MKSRTLLIIAFIFVNITLIAATIWWLNKPEPLAFNCQGQLNFKESRDNNPFNFDGQIVMHFNPDGSGEREDAYRLAAGEFQLAQPAR